MQSDADAAFRWRRETAVSLSVNALCVPQCCDAAAADNVDGQSTLTHAMAALTFFVQVRVNGKDLVGMTADDVVRLLDTAPVSEVAPIFACSSRVSVEPQI